MRFRRDTDRVQSETIETESGMIGNILEQPTGATGSEWKRSCLVAFRDTHYRAEITAPSGVKDWDAFYADACLVLETLETEESITAAAVR